LSSSFFIYFYVSGYILPPNEIYSCIKYITSLDLPSSQHPIGVLTSENRDRWATLREKLLRLGNEEQIRLIDSAFFNLILDDDKMEDDPVKIVRSFLHGDGDNRYYHRHRGQIPASWCHLLYSPLQKFRGRSRWGGKWACTPSFNFESYTNYRSGVANNNDM